MKDFAAIDFETANRYPSSACSVGVVIVRSGCVVERFYQLIRPYPNFYSWWATACHGLTAVDTDHAEPFPAVWAQIAPHIADLPLVAHNKAFDRQCLIGCHAHYGIAYPDYPFLCTLLASRRKLPQLPDHKLDTVASYVGFTLDNHHNALADAEACAAIALRLL